MHVEPYIPPGSDIYACMHTYYAHTYTRAGAHTHMHMHTTGQGMNYMVPFRGVSTFSLTI